MADKVIFRRVRGKVIPIKVRKRENKHLRKRKRQVGALGATVFGTTGSINIGIGFFAGKKTKKIMQTLDIVRTSTRPSDLVLPTANPRLKRMRRIPVASSKQIAVATAELKRVGPTAKMLKKLTKRGIVQFGIATAFAGLALANRER